MLDKLLRDVVAITVGKQSEQIADLLNSSKHVNEFIIAKKMNITINQARNILYKISDFGLVSSERKKDKKKGWYTYYWKFEILKALNFLKDLLVKEKEEMSLEIKKREQNKHYFCKLCNLEYEESEALFMDFTCDECGELFEVKEDSRVIKDLNKSIERIDEKINIIDQEFEKENNKLDKKKAAIAKKEEKEKEEKKAAKKKETALKRAAKKKIAKKPVKKSRSGPLKVRNAGRKTIKKKIVKKKANTKKKITKKPVKSKPLRGRSPIPKRAQAQSLRIKKIVKKRGGNKKSIKKKISKNKKR